MRAEKRIVRSFYDTFGWQKTNTGFYYDTAIFLDNRLLMDVYGSRVRRRVGRFLNPQGKYLLDAASGAVPFEEYCDYSAMYRKRICVDFSLVALHEARNRLGTRGFYVLCDISELPFRKAVFDGIVSLHTIYHVPADEQELVVKELVARLAPGGKLVIVTVLPRSLLTVTTLFARRSLSRVVKATPFVNWMFRCWEILTNKKVDKESSTEISGMDPPPLYCFPSKIAWWKAILKDYPKYEIRIWCTVDRSFSENFIPDNWLGRVILWLIYALETMAPHIMVHIGRYPMIVICNK